jgi:hypothetical protein
MGRYRTRHACITRLFNPADFVSDMFEHLFTIHADISPVPKVPRCVSNSYAPGDVGGSLYFQQRFRIVLLFGMTELKAQIRWRENVSAPRPGFAGSQLISRFEGVEKRFSLILS